MLKLENENPNLSCNGYSITLLLLYIPGFQAATSGKQVVLTSDAILTLTLTPNTHIDKYMPLRKATQKEIKLQHKPWIKNRNPEFH